MDVLEAHGKAPMRMRPWMVALAVLSIVALIIVFTSAGSNGGKGNHSGAGATGTTTTATLPPLALASSSPATGATAVPPDTTVTLTFSRPVSLHKIKPTLSPPVAGSWTQPSRTTLAYDLTAPFIPSSHEVVT